MRKKYFNQMEDMKGKIRVYARVRPHAALRGRARAAGARPPPGSPRRDSNPYVGQDLRVRELHAALRGRARGSRGAPFPQPRLDLKP